MTLLAVPVATAVRPRWPRPLRHLGIPVSASIPAALLLCGGLVLGSWGCGTVESSGTDDQGGSEDADAAPADAQPAPGSADAQPDARPGKPDIPTAGLIAAYEFDEPARLSFPDDSGNGHDAVCVKSCPPLAEDRDGTGSAASFGDGHYLRIDGDDTFRTLDGFTVTAWVLVRRLPGADFACAVCKPLDGTALNSWGLMVADDGRPLFYSAADINDDFLVGNQGVILDEWLHLAITWDGEAKQIWINGVVSGASQTSIDIADDPVIIGGDIDGGAFVIPFDGLIDEVRMYDRPLDADEISRLAEMSTDS